jgi:hypothetical protein
MMYSDVITIIRVVHKSSAYMIGHLLHSVVTSSFVLVVYRLNNVYTYTAYACIVQQEQLEVRT